MKRLKIAQLAPLWYPIPPSKYGGIERIIHYLTEGLIERGHRVYLFASGNSQTKAELISCRAKGLAQDKIPWTDSFWPLEHLSFAFQTIIKKIRNIDVVHAHTGIRTFFFQPFLKIPTVHTFHNPIVNKRKKLPPALQIFKRYARLANVCFISKEAKRLCPIKPARSWVVYNGIDLSLFKFSASAEDYLLWVGRVANYKGIEDAIEVARRTKMKLNLVGKLDPEKKPYFEKKIKPYLGRKIRYLGELSQKRLNRLYQKAKAFIYPIAWPEPFGLTMVEAQACGTPVIVFDRGSAKEVVKNKKTGFVVPFFNQRKEKNFEGLIEAVKNISKIKREDCRQFVEENFTLKKMIDNYEKIYYQLASQRG